ncbi:uncharacterized protein F4812DRAFT_464085 [Daldinia caldariorum]|uniref:uncharacterized protein n=1 Tax=Daldinia caldariorum TaxID=326644 RepID=UPI0020078D91|nr:uncharacterized protein F4812DRAFT_464085 [Daldinia caldariorum]KAI1463086.1 hypothetical protein F4812DRAFT_464085 [Daldinia caldariorum]
MSGRSTRARSRGTGASGTPKTSRQNFFSEPPPADLPGLYPVHDGSYGVNTLLNLDSAKKSRGRKAKPGFVNEDDEDERFTGRIERKGGQRYTMDNDLKRVVEETVEEAEKDDGFEAEIESRQALIDNPDQPNTQSGAQQSDPKQGSRPRTRRVDDYKGPRVTKLGRMFPPEEKDTQSPPYAPISYRSPDPEKLIHNANSSAPPPFASSFYGVPTGRGAGFPSSSFVAPARAPIPPDSSRSFTSENGLYGDASFIPPPSREPAHEGDSAGKPSGSNKSGPRDISMLGLTPGEQQRVESIIRDMRTLPLHQAPGSSSTPINSLNHPTEREVRAVRTLTRDMGDDWARNDRILAELDRITNQIKNNRQARTPKQPDANLPTPASSNVISNTHDHPVVDELPKQDPTTVDTSKTQNRNAIDTDADNATNANGNMGNDQPINSNLPPVQPMEELPPVDDGLPDADNGEFGQFFNHNAPTDSPNDHNHDSPQTPNFRLERPIKRRKDRYTNRKRDSLFDWAAAGSSSNWASMGFVFLTILFCAWLLLTVIDGDFASPRDEVFVDPGTQWPNWDIIKDNIGKLIPSGTSGSGSNFDFKSGDTQSKLVNNLTPKIPDQVFVEKDGKGKLRISQDFWHALRNLIREDDIILTLENVRKEAPEISNAHWLAIKSRLSKDGFGLHTGSNASSGGHMAHADKHSCLRCWDNWVSQNEEALKRMVGGVAVSKDEFLKLFRGEIKSYQQEIRKELTAQDARIKELAEAMTALRNTAKNLHGGLTEREVKAICDAAIRKAIENAKLDALASGRIRGHANDMIVNQVNFFGVGSGAVIDPHSSSRPWELPKDSKYKSKEWYLHNGYRPQPPSSAISPWSEEGECFCAGKIVKGVPEITNAIGIMTSVAVIPQHLVVEHILPGSTLDPNAMPKDIEVWAYIEEVTLREEVRAFSSNNIHNQLEAEAPTVPDGFVKIGHFTYEQKDYGDGVQIFKMSSELTSMRAATKHVIIKAVTNYGADHTCFYRLKLYGEAVDSRRWEVDHQK